MTRLSIKEIKAMDRRDLQVEMMRLKREFDRACSVLKRKDPAAYDTMVCCGRGIEEIRAELSSKREDAGPRVN